MSTPDPGPLAADASLHLLADHLVDALAADEVEPALLHVCGLDRDGFDVATMPLDGRHPTALLLGTVAPDDWHAIGIATAGRAFPLSDRSRPDRDGTRVHVVTIVSRTGELVHRTRSDDRHLQSRLADESPSGEQLDLLQRALGRATPPPPTPAATFWSIEWLAAVTAEPAPTQWAAAVGRHPVTRLLTSVPHRDDDLVDVIAAFHRVCDWTRLRQLAIDGVFDAVGLAPDHAVWLDDGAFARYMLNRCPPLGHLRTQTRQRLPMTVADRVFEVLERLGIPERSWPDAPDDRRRVA